MLTGSLPFSRNKEHIKHLNILLDNIRSQSNPQIKSQRILRKTTSQSRPLTTVINGYNLAKNLSLSSTVTNSNTRKTSHSWYDQTKQSIGRTYPASEQRDVKNSQQMRKQKMINILSMQNMRKQLIQSRKSLQQQNKQKIKENKERNKNKEYDLRNNVIVNKGNRYEWEMRKKDVFISTGYYRKQIQNGDKLFHQYRSEELMRNQSDYSHKSFKATNGISQTTYNYNSEGKQKQKKQYLKKGSSLSKNILNSILRVKLTKYPTDFQSADMQKYINNEQIVNMIKVYKGKYPVFLPVVPYHEPQKKIEHKVQQKTDKEKENQEFGRWNNEVDEFDLRFNVPQIATSANAGEGQK